MNYQHRSASGNVLDLPLGKIVCVGRNYADHAKELNNPVPKEPVLFMKPATAARSLEQAICLPEGRGACHFETEISLLIGKPISGASKAECVDAIQGVGLGLDLTLRDLQNTLKQQSLPWEKAKAFDGSCPLSGFVEKGQFPDLNTVTLQLHCNGVLQQAGTSASMLTAIPALLAYISQHFTLLPGDVVMTGTPAGVGPLAVGDDLVLALGAGDGEALYSVKTRVHGPAEIN